MRAAEELGPQILFDFSPENGEDRRLIYGASSNAKGPERRPIFPWDPPIMSNPTKTQYKGRVFSRSPSEGEGVEKTQGIRDGVKSLAGAITECGGKRRTQGWRTQDERGPPKAITVAYFRS